MSERPFMQLYVSDFIGDTLQLSTEQIGAYMLLLMAMWNAEGTLPDDDAKLARVVRMSIKKWRAISDDLMIYFERHEGVISHNRLTKELQKSDRKSQSRASAGAKGGAAKALKNNNAGLANAKQMPQHLPDTITREDTSVSSKSAGAFDAFWSAYPHKVGKRDAEKAFAKALKRTDLQTLISGLHRYVSKTDDRPWCNPATWLNQDRWADQPAVVQPRGSPPQNQRGNPAAAARRRLEASENDRRNRPDHDDFEPAARLISSDGQRFG